MILKESILASLETVFANMFVHFLLSLGDDFFDTAGMDAAVLNQLCQRQFS